jgi:sialate O-acetylesterase
LFVAAALALLPVAARADVKLHPLFCDGMVLQQDTECPIWGTADPGEMVGIAVKYGKSGGGSSTTADKDGRWQLKLPRTEVGGPYTIAVQGKNTITLKDVYVGEVWVASGQSNMEWSVNAAAGADEAKKNAGNAKLRLFTVKKTVADKPLTTVPVDNYNGKWLEANASTIGPFSAVGYYFGRDLQKDLDVPVGIIHTSWGGTVAEAWASKEALAANSDLKRLIPAEIKVPGPRERPNPNQGTCLYNGMIHPLLPFPVKGAIWYQGESNAGRAAEYRTLFPTMIESWRTAWNNRDMPFLFVQLAPYAPQGEQPDPDWARLRDAQLATTRKLKNTAMAVITDVGEIKDIHPKKKEPVGHRLALAAEVIAYGKKIEHSGPVYDKMTVDGNKAVLTFTHLGGGLEAKDGALTGFTVAGEDKVFHAAEAEIKGDTIVVSSKDVAKPVAVRFGWANYPTVNLWNKAGLPASPFRTDDWPKK